MTTPDMILRRLRDTLDGDEQLAARLEQSLIQARESAHAELDPDVFEALEWPQNLDEYDEYVEHAIRWVPQQTDAKAWKKQAPEERYAKEVSDRLAHFFWLVDQKVTGDDGGESAAPQDSEEFRGWLTLFARHWGTFLDTTESFSNDILESFIENAPEYRVDESMVNGRPNAPSGWLTFNQFFARELNAGLRPVSDPLDNRVITSPADCSFQQTYDIDDESNIPATTIKGTHRYGNIEQLIEGSRYADAFAGGTFAHYQLPPSAYHRFHLPVAGQVRESFVIEGKVFMQVALEDHQLQPKDTTQSGYEFFQTRGAVVIDTAGSAGGDIGLVGVVSVGMSHVASVILTTVADTPAAKGEEFGYFQFGGSDIVLLFQKGAAAQVDTDTSFRLVGSLVARCSLRTG